MTNEQINIAIAEHMGWKNLHKIPQIVSLHSGWSGIKPDTGNDEFIPDYCNDLNAMHEVEKTLSGPIIDKYVNNCMSEAEWWFPDALTLSARQRAEVFLKTIGKWNDQ
jgi:hypothetical protein